MYQLTSITANSKQRFSFADDNIENIDFYLYFSPLQQTWFIDITQGDFVLKGCAISNYINILDKYSNIIKFGLQCTTSDGLDPWRIDDFVNDYAQLILLEEDDVKQIREYLNG